MSCAQVADRQVDRILAGVTGESWGWGISDLEGIQFVSLGVPEFSESLMCAKCIGECKIF